MSAGSMGHDASKKKRASDCVNGVVEGESDHTPVVTWPVANHPPCTHQLQTAPSTLKVPRACSRVHRTLVSDRSLQ